MKTILETSHTSQGNHERDLTKYLFIQGQIKELTEQLDELKPDLLEFVSLSGGKFKYQYHTFIVGERKSYQYSEDTRQLEKEVKAKKKYEEMAGVASIKTASPYLLVRTAKKQDPSPSIN